MQGRYFSNSLQPHVTLEKGVKVTKTLNIFHESLIYLYKFGQNPSIRSGDKVQTIYLSILFYLL